MLDKINKLIVFSKDESSKIHNRLISIAEKIQKDISSGKSYLLIDTKEMEGLVSPESVDVEKTLGNVGLEL